MKSIKVKCRICGEIFETSKMNKVGVCSFCLGVYIAILNRIKTIWFFDKIKQAEELTKFECLGGKYRFTREHSKFNFLTGLVKQKATSLYPQ